TLVICIKPKLPRSITACNIPNKYFTAICITKSLPFHSQRSVYVKFPFRGCCTYSHISIVCNSYTFSIIVYMEGYVSPHCTSTAVKIYGAIDHSVKAVLYGKTFSSVLVLLCGIS